MTARIRVDRPTGPDREILDLLKGVTGYPGTLAEMVADVRRHLAGPRTARDRPPEVPTDPEGG